LFFKLKTVEALGVAKSHAVGALGPGCGETALDLLNDKSRTATSLCVNVQILDTGLGEPLKN